MFTDVTLSADDMSFEAHRLVLSACSPYFRNLLTTTKCKHPVIFLKDISGEHVGLLLRYMYLGQIAVKKEDLTTFLKAADHLRVRGLTMTTPTSDEPPQPRHDVVIPSQDEDEDQQRKIIATTTSNKGRKGYLPKKIRTSGDRISDSSSPGQSLSDPGASPVPLRRMSGNSTLPTIMETCQTFNNNSKDNLDLEQEGTATTTEEENEEDQPVDFSQNTLTNGSSQQKYSILSEYLKTGKLGHKIINHDSKMGDNEAASISKAAEVKTFKLYLMKPH